MHRFGNLGTRFSVCNRLEISVSGSRHAIIWKSRHPVLGITICIDLNIGNGISFFFFRPMSFFFFCKTRCCMFFIVLIYWASVNFTTNTYYSTISYSSIYRRKLVFYSYVHNILRYFVR